MIMHTTMQEHNSSSEDAANIRATHYYVLQAQHVCAKCQNSTTVTALAVPGPHQCTESDTLAQDDDFTGLDGPAFRDWLFAPEQWYDIAGPAIITSIAHLPAAVATHVAAINPHYSPDGQGNARQWINHCAQCGAPIGDGILHASRGNTFSPKDSDAAASITVHHITAPLSAYYGMCWNDDYDIKQALFERIYSVQS